MERRRWSGWLLALGVATAVLYLVRVPAGVLLAAVLVLATPLLLLAVRPNATYRPGSLGEPDGPSRPYA